MSELQIGLFYLWIWGAIFDHEAGCKTNMADKSKSVDFL